MAAPKKRREAERELKKQGFEKQSGRGKGSHEVWKNDQGVSVTVPNHGDEIAAGTWRSIERQAGQAQQQAAADAAEAQRLANEGVTRPGNNQGRGSGQQDQQSGRRDRGRGRGGRGGRG